MATITQDVLDQLFFTARTQNGWLEQPVADDQLRQIFDLMKWAPTSANSSPARFVFVKTPAAKERLLACAAPGNVEKIKAAPVCVIVAEDLEFYEKLPKLFPHADARSWFVGNQAMIEKTSFRNSTLQGAYFILAARALGLDCGPMSGFDNAKLDAEFFAGTAWRSNFLINLGHGDPAKVFPRSPRLDFDEACKIL